VKCESKLTPVTIGATGTVSELFRTYLSNVPGKHEIKELQKTAIHGHCTQTAGSDDITVQNIQHGK
jgi:hypothetical protein